MIRFTPIRSFFVRTENIKTTQGSPTNFNQQIVTTNWKRWIPGMTFVAIIGYFGWHYYIQNQLNQTVNENQTFYNNKKLTNSTKMTHTPGLNNPTSSTSITGSSFIGYK